MNLWMVYICNMKSSGKYKWFEDGGCALLCILERNYDRSVVIIDTFRNFKGI